ncbi:hypothetical protein [Nitrobacter winogradskyi]|uniref:Uncharacterized protein n=1 Tax=Nitrobacter winogradskyi TaxID=913 RepID=A0ACC6AJB7_NITWI|nr:hypothetical protein [Nitrobacter winogradskyi]MCP1999756.1 hypothetical protein [Nitrobacter winogradskyi]
MPFRTETVRNGVYVELVRSLYAMCRRASADLDELLGLADQALYVAKNSETGIECNDSLLRTAGRLAA